MRLKKFLLESDNLDLENIIKECMPFIKEANTKSAWYTLYHGTQKLKPGKYNVQKNRTPRDSPPAVHNFMNKIHKQTLGIDLRSNCVFATRDWLGSRNYGSSYCLVPVGNFTMYQNPMVSDAYFLFNLTSSKSPEYAYKAYDINFWNILDTHKIVCTVNSSDIFQPTEVVKDDAHLQRICSELSAIKLDNNYWKLGYTSGPNDMDPKEIYAKITKPVYDKLRNELANILKQTKKVQMKDLIKDHEIMIVCESFYLLSRQQFEDLEELYESK